MASAGWRLTNGHRAALCGLLLAGQPFIQCCKIIGVSPKRMRTYLPKDWAHHRNPARTKWTGLRLAALARDYRAHSLSVRTIIARHHVTQGTLYKLAQTHGWPTRRKGRRPNKRPDTKVARLIEGLRVAKCFRSKVDTGTQALNSEAADG